MATSVELMGYIPLAEDGERVDSLAERAAKKKNKTIQPSVFCLLEQ